jgi:hypothetical protein
LAGQQVRGVHRERGLAEPARAHHKHHANRPRAVLAARAGQQLTKLVHLLGPAGEIRDGRGQLRGYREGRGHGSPRGERDGGLLVVGVQYLLVEQAKLGARIDAELVGDPAPGLLVDLQRLGLAPCAIQRAHEQGPQLLPERVVGEQPAHLGHHLGVPAAGQVRLSAQLQRLDPRLLQPVRFDRHQRRRWHIGQRPAPPEPDRLGKQVSRPLRGTGCQRLAAVGDQRGEPVRVQLTGAEHDLVSGRPGDQHPPAGVPDQPAQVVHVHADQVGRPGRRLVRPDLVDERIEGHRLTRAQQQRGKYRPLLPRPDAGPAFARPRLDRTENAEQSRPGWLNHALIVAQSPAGMLDFSLRVSNEQDETGIAAGLRGGGPQRTVTWQPGGRPDRGTFSSHSANGRSRGMRLRGARWPLPRACRGGAAVTVKQPSGSSSGRPPAESQPSAGGPALRYDPPIRSRAG